MITGAQVRAAKALIGWSGNDLANKAGVGLSTIRRIEGCDGLLEAASIKTLQAIQKALELGGVEFLGTPDNSPGVRLKTQKQYFAKRTIQLVDELCLGDLLRPLMPYIKLKNQHLQYLKMHPLWGLKVHNFVVEPYIADGEDG